MMTPTVYFFHGRDSNPHSHKILRLSTVARAAGWNVVVPDFSSTTDPDQRVRTFLEMDHSPGLKKVFVGSSMGAYVALIASRTLAPDALLLLAPAVGVEGYAETQPEPVAEETVIVHGWNDTVIGSEKVYNFARGHHATLHLVDDEHMLHQSVAFIEQVLSGLLKRCCPISRRSRLTAVL